MSGMPLSGKLWEALARLRGIFVTRPRLAAHLLTGRRGEDLAYAHLRRLGYVMVARNWRCEGRRGEIDLIGWDGDLLCFIEVKTRRSRQVATAEAAVDRRKKTELLAMASAFMNGYARVRSAASTWSASIWFRRKNRKSNFLRMPSAGVP